MATTKQKRSNGTGTVYKDKARGKWVAQFRYLDPRTGRMRSVKRVRDDHDEAVVALKELREGVEAAKPRAHTKVRVGEMVADWSASKTGWSPATRQRHENYHAHLKTITDLYADEATAEDLDALFRRLVADGASLGDVRRLRQDLANAWDRALARGRVNDRANPARLADLPEPMAATAEKKQQDRGRAFSRDEVDKMVAKALSCHPETGVPDHRLGSALVVAFYTGLRPGEVRGLRWDAIDLDAATIAVAGQMSADERQRPVEGRLKTEKSYRVLRVPPVVVDALRAHQKRQHEEEALGVWPDEWAGLVFRTQNGTPMNKMGLWRLFRRVATTAQIEGTISPYDARKTFTTLLVEEYQVPHYKVADILGHRDLRMIELHYRKSTTPVVDVASVFAQESGDSSDAKPEG